MVEKHRHELLADTRTCYRYRQAGFGVILLTFVVGVVVLVAPGLTSVYEVMVVPSLFVGLGLLLLGAGTQPHIMHLNVLERRDQGGSHG